MTTEPLRRRSIFPVRSQADPVITEAQIAEVASRNGFEATPQSRLTSQADVHSSLVVTATMTNRRMRQPTGRDHQFNVRLKKETIEFIYQISNSRNVPIAQVIEEMADAFRTSVAAKR